MLPGPSAPYGIGAMTKLSEKLAVAEAKHRHKPMLLEENPRLPFADAEFGIVFCSSVIEHVTGRKDTVAHVRSASAFEE